MDTPAETTDTTRDFTTHPLTTGERAVLKAGELYLHLGFIDTAARDVIRSARRATHAQVLVLHSALVELLRRVEEAKKIKLCDE
jgi:hypothetical protein